MDIEVIKSNDSINIQRTDGRIHLATISSVDAENQLVLVEWLENDESKGKEIDLADVKRINPSLFSEKASKSSRTLRSNANLIESKSAQRPMNTAVLKELPNNEKQQRPKQQPLQQPQQKFQLPRKPKQPQHPLPPTTGHTKVPSLDMENTMEEVAGSDCYQNIGSQAHLDMDSNNAASHNTSVDETKRITYKKKSSCVKEVERIQQRRIERRAQQLAFREHCEADTSVPNWEFKAMIQEYRSSLNMQPLAWEEGAGDKQICVCLRKRPLNKKENGRKEVDVISIPGRDLVVLHEPKTKVDLTKYLENQSFKFDYAFDENTNNETIYRYTAQPLVECTFQGGMSTCFAYGQTGSGKTHTMGGDFTGSKGKQDCSRGIYVLAASDVFRLLSTKYKKLDLSLSASFFEIYSGKVFDLLNERTKLKVLEDGKQQVQVVGLKEEAIADTEDVLKFIQSGNSVRTLGQTSANVHSSRSHAVFQIILRKRVSGKLYGKFSLIDLAGNERGADTMESERSIRMEGAEINKSLLALKECIRALGRGGAHLPFRVSKLTQVLRDSFIGENSRTCMIAMISPGLSCCEQTLNTLRYAARMKELEPSAAGNTTKCVSNNLPPNTHAFSTHHLPLTVPSPTPSSSSSISCHEEITTQKATLDISRNSNNEDLANYLYNETREMEDDVVEKHKELAAEALTWVRMDRKLLSMTESVDYDVEAYANELKRLLQVKVTALQSLADKVQKLKDELNAEVYLSKNIKKKNK